MEETQKEIYEHEKEEYERKMKERKEHPDVKVICATEREPHGKTVKQIFEKLPERLPEEKSGETMSKEKCGPALKHKRDRKSTQKERQL